MSRSKLFTYIEALCVAFFILNEAIPFASLIGGAVILFGVRLVNQV